MLGNCVRKTNKAYAGKDVVAGCNNNPP
jgi:hypothetical protein